MGSMKGIVGEDLSDKHIADLMAKGLNFQKKNGKTYLVTKTVTAPRRIQEQDDDIAILAMILPGEKFECTLKDDCLLGDPKFGELGTKKMEYKGRQWHEQCFACNGCKEPIGTKSFIPRDLDIYCPACHEDKFSPRCGKCQKILACGGVTYKDQPLHRECFVCTGCKVQLVGKKFTSKNDKPYCADCFGENFAKRCFACRKPISGIGSTRYISFHQRQWHNDCFVCVSCKTSLVRKGFISDDDDIICAGCAKQRLIVVA